jgi:hypothetical protein
MLNKRLLQRGSMFVFSMAQFQSIMEFSDGFKLDSLLDIGFNMFFFV